MKEKRYHIVITTVVCAVLLWGFVKLGNQYQTTVEIPIDVSDLPEGVAIRTSLPRDIQMVLRGEGWQLAALFWKSNLRYHLDLSGIGNIQKVVTIRDVSRQLDLNPGVELLDMKPESLFIAVGPYVIKKIPVRFGARVTFAEGYGLASPPTIIPESTIVGGAPSVLNALVSWNIRDTIFENLKAPVETPVALEDSTPFVLSFSPSSVIVKLDVQPFAEKTLSNLPVDIRSVPADREVILIPPKIEIVVRGGVNRLTTVAATDCKAYIKYEDVRNDTTRSLSPEIELPGGLVLIGKKPEHLQYVIRKRL